MDQKTNEVQLTGNLVSDPRISTKATFITLAIPSGKDGAPIFIDVTLFNPKDRQKLSKGKKVHIKGKLGVYKDKTTGYTKISVIGKSVEYIERNTDKEFETKVLKQFGIKENNSLDDVPWEE